MNAGPPELAGLHSSDLIGGGGEGENMYSTGDSIYHARVLN